MFIRRGKFPFAGSSRGVANLYLEIHGLVFYIRENLDIFHPHRRRGAKLNTAHKTIPVGLGRIGDAVGVFADVLLHPVIDPHMASNTKSPPLFRILYTLFKYFSLSFVSVIQCKQNPSMTRRINATLRVRQTQTRPGINRLKTHPPHQPPHAITLFKGADLPIVV